jgi:hypothetical protein
VLAADPERAYVAHLRRKFAGDERFEAMELTLGDWSAQTPADVRRFRPDTFVCLNVLEHVEQDAQRSSPCTRASSLAYLLPFAPIIYVAQAVGIASAVTLVLRDAGKPA